MIARFQVTDRLPDGRVRLHGDASGYPLAEAMERSRAPGLWAVTVVQIEGSDKTSHADTERRQ